MATAPKEKPVVMEAVPDVTNVDCWSAVELATGAVTFVVELTMEQLSFGAPKVRLNSDVRLSASLE